MNIETEFFGSSDQQLVSQRASWLWNIVKDDPRFHSHGRSIALNYDEDVDINLHTSLTRLLGLSACDGIPVSEAVDYIRELEALGFKTDRYELWHTKSTALSIAKQITISFSLADDLEVVIIDQETPTATLQELSEMTQNCGVFLPMGAFLRGISRPSVFMFVRDKTGMPVGHAASVQIYPDNAKYSKDAFWGMLATHDQRRGERIALVLGAMSMLEMHHRFGPEKFFTGIKNDNESSKGLCNKLGLAQTDKCIVIAIDPEVFSGDQITK